MTGSIEPRSDAPRVPATNVHIAEVPSAAWGWSGEAPRTFRIAGWIVSLFLLAMIIGNHTGRVEDLWLIGFAVLLWIVLIRDILLRRKPRRG
ncbi:DUF2631 domain-containing protein [Rhodococcoides corynebacterioides]|uniref:DUF2631 domain-containing protein n=1 Tax=Rhodococcoides corynebacterioides TaxID=53972 RepID=UPI00082F6998